VKYINTYWEERNFDMSSCEIRVELKDSFEEFAALDSGLQEQYRVAKIPVNMPDFLFGLPKLGYVFVETQMQLSMKKEEAKARMRIPGCEDYLDRVEFVRIESLEELDAAISCIKDGEMFNTDRIALDPALGGRVSGKRYYNWIRDIFLKDGGGVYVAKMDGTNLSFSTLERKENGVVSTAMGGIFPEAQNNAYSFIALYQPAEYAFDVMNAKMVETAVSSNNSAVLKVHLQRGFRIKKLNYVYIKCAEDNSAVTPAFINLNTGDND